MIRSILIVDPDADLREMIGALLSLEGHTPRFARDILEANDILRRMDRFDLILMDAALEGALTFIKKHCDIPVIVVTSGNKRVVNKATEVGAVAVFTKPFHLDNLLGSMAEALGSIEQVASFTSMPTRGVFAPLGLT